jgi:hypothetical protein
MRLEFLTSEFAPSRQVLAMTEELVAKAAADISVPAEELADVLIADDANYPRAVERIAPGGGFTQHASGTRGMAKTNSLRDSSGNLSHKIVIHLHVLDGALGSLFDETGKKPERVAAEQLCFYLLYHELGHCKDNRTRPDRPKPPISVPGKGFEISQVTRYYADILEEEYAACMFAARWMSLAAYESSADALADHLRFFRSESDRLTVDYSEQRSSLSNVAATVAGLAWFQLIQFAQTSASRRGNSALSDTAIAKWPEPEDEMICDLLSEFEVELSTHWDRYPDWPSEPEPFLRETWESFTLLSGFRFVEDERGSAIYW